MVYGLDSLVHLYSSYFHGNRPKPGMDSTEWRRRGKEMVDYIADYLENIQDRRVVPAVEPGYLKGLLPQEAPRRAERFEDVMGDVEKYIMPGITHWQHPRFHAYFPAGNSYPSILADMLSDAIGCVGFSWAASPACTELETIMMQWMGQLVGLPEDFLPYTPHAKGGGVIQGSASECILVSLLAARFETLKRLKLQYPFVEDGILLSKLVAYSSREAHSSVEKACMIGFVKLHSLDTDDHFRLNGKTLQHAINEDKSNGLIPFFVSTTLGTTSCVSFDIISEIGPVCTKEQLWMHVDAAYAGSAMICPEFKYLMDGIEHASSFNMNPNKWMLVNFDCSLLWVRDRVKLTQALVVDPLYLQHGYMDKAIDYRHWGIPLSRRFRALKLWFVVRMYGIEGIQRYIREHIKLAKYFEQLVRADDRFTVIGDVIMGLVCFRLNKSNEINKRLLTCINASGRLHMVPCSLNNQFVIRFCVCAERATEQDMEIAWENIKQLSTQVECLNIFASAHMRLANGLVTGLKDCCVGGTAAALASQPAQPLTVSGTSTCERTESEDLDESIDDDDDVGAEDDFLGGSSLGTETSSGHLGHLTAMANKSSQLSAKLRRSYFVKMVSDPKCYNPSVVRGLTTTGGPSVSRLHEHTRLSDGFERDNAMRCDLSLAKLSLPELLEESGDQTKSTTDTKNLNGATVAPTSLKGITPDTQLVGGKHLTPI